MKFPSCLLVVAIHLSACSGEQHPAARIQNDLNDTTVLLNSDALRAPAQPELIITAAPESLQLAWQTDQQGRLANVYVYNKLLREETLIQGNLTADISSISIDSRTPRRAWHNELFRLELCDESDCVSSARVSLNTLAAATTTLLRPSVFIAGERFAENIAANHDASVVFATRPLQGAIQVFFHNQAQWVETTPVAIDNTGSISIKKIDSSDSGDTLAALSISDETTANIHIIERLGEGWIPTATLPVPASMAISTSSDITMSANGDALLLHAENSFVVYQRDTFDWVLETPIEPDLNAIVKAAAVNGQFDTIYLLIQQNGQVWLDSYAPSISTRNQSDGQEQAVDGLQTDSSRPVQTWQSITRSLIQGVDAQDDLLLRTNADASSVIVAGWNNTIITQRAPVMWRMNATGDPASAINGGLQTVDSLQATPTPEIGARLRFSASEDLNTIVLGWQSLPGDAAEISTYTYHTRDRRWHSSLELPHELTRLAKQAFAHNVLLSADGETLLVTTPSGNASIPSNRVGELRIFR